MFAPSNSFREPKTRDYPCALHLCSGISGSKGRPTIVPIRESPKWHTSEHALEHTLTTHCHTPFHTCSMLPRWLTLMSCKLLPTLLYISLQNGQSYFALKDKATINTIPSHETGRTYTPFNLDCQFINRCAYEIFMQFPIQSYDFLKARHFPWSRTNRTPSWISILSKFATWPTTEQTSTAVEAHKNKHHLPKFKVL